MESTRILAAQRWIEELWGWEDVAFRPCQMLEQGIHIQLHHASQDDATSRPRVYLDVGPGYPIAVSGKPLIVGYPSQGQTVVLSWRKQGILGIRASLDMLTDPSESLNVSPKRSTFDTGRFASCAGPLESGGNLDLGLEESTMIDAGVDPEEAGTLLDGPRRLNEERDPDKAAGVSSSEGSDGSASKIDKLPVGSSEPACILLGRRIGFYPRFPVSTKPCRS